MNRSAGVALAVALLAGIVWASNAPLPAHRSNHGVLRLAWSARPERVEKCRQRTEEELEKLPRHMRQPLACEGTTAEYRLQVRIDGALAAERVVRAGGLRRDRRLYVFEELPLHAGVETTIDVRLDRVESAETRSAATPPFQTGAVPDGATSSSLRDSVPPHLSIERRLRLSPREVVLVTYEREQRALAVVPETR